LVSGHKQVLRLIGGDKLFVIKKPANREDYLYIFFLIIFCLLIFRVVYLQVFCQNFLQNLADGQHYRIIPLEGKRGKFIDSQGRVIVTGLNSYSIFADPKLTDKKSITAQKLALILSLPAQEILNKLTKPKRFIWIKRKVSWADNNKIKKMKFKGISFLREERRFYSQETLASATLGAVDIDNKGISGLELQYDRYLRGKNGMVKIVQDAATNEIIVAPQRINPQQGADVVLTIDAQIQYWVETYLAQKVKEFSAAAGSVVIMNAVNGEILALANYPNFNPNQITPDALKYIKNRAICDMFEPGSVFKIVTLLAAVEENKFRDSDVIFCENGQYKIPGTILHDWKPYGNLSFVEVFKKSSNIGVGKIANTLGPEKFYNYVKLLGFGEKTGIDLHGEINGWIKPTQNWSKTTSYIFPIGQEVGVNLIQLARALAVIANGGYLVKPHLVKYINGDNFFKEISGEKKRVASQSGTKRVRDILVQVVSSGTGKLAAIEGVRIGGKTGTAQKFDPAIGRYSPDKLRASFIGFIENLEFPIVIAITVDEPKKSHFGGVVAAPLFKSIAEKLIKYYSGKQITVKP
jgi:cell division protein FtsI (penicillin-binding protein 3)